MHVRYLLASIFFLGAVQVDANECEVHGVWYGYTCDPYPEMFLQLKKPSPQKEKLPNSSPLSNRSYIDMQDLYKHAYKMPQYHQSQTKQKKKDVKQATHEPAQIIKHAHPNQKISPSKLPVFSKQKNIDYNATNLEGVLVKSSKPLKKIVTQIPQDKVPNHPQDNHKDHNTTHNTPQPPLGQKEEKKVAVSGVYRVQKGDTLLAIAKRFGVSPKQIKQTNTIKDSSFLKEGQSLVLPLEQSTIDAISSGLYEIKSGDTIIKIAKRFAVDPKELVRFNQIDNSSSIKIGDKLKLPLPHIVKKEKKVKKITKKRSKKRKAHITMLGIPGKRRLRVIATAYTSHRGQTDSTPFLAAWNNRLRPGMKVIAVSRDLISRYGLTNGSKVRIGGLPGVYTVRDKMNKRYRRRIDIYMGTDRKRALRWGRRSVVIYF